MSELFHPGHPDADQLSAFAEHSLPDHERLETLAHLAECADCRQIVFLAQQALEAENLLPQALPVHPSWFKNWQILWPVGAALTGSLLLTVFLQRRHPVDLAKRSDIAFESSPLASPSQARYLQPVVPEAPAAQKPSSAAKVTAPLGSIPTGPHVAAGRVGSLQGDAPSQPLSGKQSMFGDKASATDHQSAEALATDSHAADSVAGASLAQAIPMQEQKDNPLPARQAQTAGLQTHGQLFSQRQASVPQSPNGPSQDAIERSASQAVTVTAAAPVIQTENAVLSPSVFSGRVAQTKSARSPLPSKLPAASVASSGLESLAVDSVGDLFFSKDAGIHWQRVTQQWAGKAVKVSLASPPSATQPAPSKALSRGATPSSNLETVGAAPAATTIGFKLTTDTGTIWSSPDGLVWTQH